MGDDSEAKPIARRRWRICGLLGLGAFVNYIDRVNLSIAAPLLARDFNLSPGRLGILFSVFLWTYAALQIPIGSIVDYVGIKWVLRVSTILWTIATLLNAFAGGLGLIVLARLLLGIAETPMMPAAWKATGYWFPQNERGMSTTIVDGSARLSNVLGIPVMAFVAGLYGWRAAFLVTAAASLFYVIVFWMFYRNPREAVAESRLSGEEYRYMIAGGAERETYHVESRSANCTVKYLLGRRKTWGLSIGYASYTYAYYLLLTWLPGVLIAGDGVQHSL